MKLKIKIDTAPVKAYLKNTESRIKRGLPTLVNRTAQAIKSDISGGIQQGVDIKGKPFTPLSSSTIQGKRIRSYKFPRRALFATGTMQNVYLAEKATLSKFKARLIMPISRQKVGVYHNEGTGPYTITPKSGNKRGVLGPLYSSRGEKYFTKKVHHPGLPKREWFGISERVKQVIFRLQRQFFSNILRSE